jgi:hypothetical protein
MHLSLLVLTLYQLKVFKIEYHEWKRKHYEKAEAGYLFNDTIPACFLSTGGKQNLRQNSRCPVSL